MFVQLIIYLIYLDKSTQVIQYLDHKPHFSFVEIPKHQRRRGSTINILGVGDPVKKNFTNAPSFCQIWFEGANEPIIAPVGEYNSITNIANEATGAIYLTCQG